MSHQHPDDASFPFFPANYANSTFIAASSSRESLLQQRAFSATNPPAHSHPGLIDQRSHSLPDDVNLASIRPSLGNGTSGQVWDGIIKPHDEPAWNQAGMSQLVLQHSTAQPQFLQPMRRPRSTAMTLPTSSINRSEIPTFQYNPSDADSGYGSTQHFPIAPPGISAALSSDVHESPSDWQSQVTDLQDDPVPLPRSSFRLGARLPQSAPATTDGDSPSPNIFRGAKKKMKVPNCDICDKSLKNQSDAKKHRMTHEKPNLCPEPGCSRRVGFATKNDLERHRKNVHKRIPRVGSKGGYICTACPASATNGTRKFWPRRDNFKAHIKRKHLEQNLETLVKDSEVQARPPDARTVVTTATHIPSEADDGGNYQNTLSSPTNDLSQQQGFPMQHPDSAFPTAADDQFGHLGMPTDPVLYNDQSCHSVPSIHISNVFHPNDAIQQPGNLEYLGPQNAHSSRHRQSLDHSFDPNDPNESYQGDVQFWPVPSKSSYHMDDDLAQPRLSNSTGSSGPGTASSDQGRWMCEHCGKVKPRECDLKKHLKRHTRPYGCVFPDCDKSFGSRNDWKRHEWSQHYILETWKCSGYSKVTNEPCHKPAFHNAKMLDDHLKGRHHGIVDARERAALCEQSHLGRDGHSHYWCGFCKKSIKQKDHCTNTREKRFAHIGDHYDKEEKKVGDWFCIQYGKARKNVTEQDRKRVRKAARTGKFEDSDDEPPPSTVGDPGWIEVDPFPLKFEADSAASDHFPPGTKSGIFEMPNYGV